MAAMEAEDRMSWELKTQKPQKTIMQDAMDTNDMQKLRMCYTATPWRCLPPVHTVIYIVGR